MGGRLVRVSVTIQISSRYYGRLLTGMDEYPGMRSVFMSGVMLDYPEYRGRRIVKLVCGESDAKTILQIAEAVCEEAVPEIQKNISRYCEL
jgi:hypothetical protein